MPSSYQINIIKTSNDANSRTHDKQTIMSRLIFINNQFDKKFRDQCYTKITTSSVVPKIPITGDCEFRAANREDDALNYLKGKPCTKNEVPIINKLEIGIDVLVERINQSDDKDSAPVVRYHGRFTQDNDKYPSLKSMPDNVWLNWCIRLLAIGSLDGQYRFELSCIDQSGDTPYLVARRKLNGIFQIMFLCQLEEYPLEEIDILADLLSEYRSNKRHRMKVLDLIKQNNCLKEDLQESLSSKKIYVKTNQNIRESVEHVFLPLINDQKEYIRKLQDRLGIKQDLNFSSMRQGQLINYQEPNKKIDFKFERAKMADYQREIEKVSPRKRNHPEIQTTFPSSPTKKREHIVNDSTDSSSSSQQTVKDEDSDIEPSIKNEDLSSRRLDSTVEYNESLNEEEDEQEKSSNIRKLMMDTTERTDTDSDDSGSTEMDTE